MRQDNPDNCTDPKCTGDVMNTCAGIPTFDNPDAELFEKLLGVDSAQY